MNAQPVPDEYTKELTKLLPHTSGKSLNPLAKG